ncbi:hypothetical protein GQ457_03G001310 [Hibiscus cannabinus]
MLSLMKSLLANEGSLWVLWVHVYVFYRLDYWSIDSKPHFSWTLKKILKLKGIMQNLVVAIGNDRDSSIRDI